MVNTTIDVSHLLALARRFHLLFTGVAVAIGTIFVALIAIFLQGQEFAEAIYFSYVGFDFYDLSKFQKTWLSCIIFTLVFILMAIALCARGLSDAIRNASLDTAAVEARRLALSCWLLVAWMVIGPSIASIVATAGYPEGERILRLDFGAGHVAAALAALVSAFLARMLAIGAELWRDHTEIV